MDKLRDRVAEVSGVSKKKVWAAGKHRLAEVARRLLCYWAVKESGISMAEMARRLRTSSPAVSRLIQCGD